VIGLPVFLASEQDGKQTDIGAALAPIGTDVTQWLSSKDATRIEHAYARKGACMSHHDHKPEPPVASGTTAKRKPGPKPGSEAAKRGGTAARDKYGSEFYREIGAVGGAKVRNQMGPNFYRDIGRLGGQTTRSRLGLEHYARIGRIGGKRRSERRKPDAKGGASAAP
jgi:general stress protein YciG